MLTEEKIRTPLMPAAVTGPGEGLLHSGLFLFCASLLIVYLQFLHNGYVCLRSDHATQIPLLFMQNDPLLYPRDWFLQHYGHFDIRFFHLFLIRMFSLPLGLTGGILAMYVILVMATLGAWIKIAERIHGSALPGLITGIAAVFVYGNELGTNHLIENVMIPRGEAFAFAYWGLYCILGGRIFIAGLLLSLSAYCQMAVGGLFAVPMLIWALARARGGAPRWKAAGRFLAGFVPLLLYPLLFKSKGFMSASTVSDMDTIWLAAYIRHPHHMLPHLWGGMWVFFLFLALLALLRGHRMRAEFPRAWPLAGMAAIVIAILALATVFIELYPVKYVILGQPFRLAVLLYVLLLLLLAPHWLRQVQAPGLLPTVRAVGLILALQSWELFSLLALAELVLTWFEDRQRRMPSWAGWALLLAAMGGALAWNHHINGVLSRIAIVSIVIAGVRSLGVFARPRLVLGLTGGAALAGALAISSFFWLPYQKWIDDGSAKYAKAAAQASNDYQFKPIPIMALERLGIWAEKNTAKDALFLIPPKPNMSSFHVWAKRSVVFAFKFFPFNPQGLNEWKERFLALQGIFETDSPAGKQALKEAMNDIGGEVVNDLFYKLTADQVFAVARRYEADYLITPTHYSDPRLEELVSDYDHNKGREKGKVYFLYRVLAKGQAARTS